MRYVHPVLLPLFDTSFRCSIMFNGDFINPFLCCALGKRFTCAVGSRLQNSVSGTTDSRCKITIGWNTLGVKKVMWLGQFSGELFALLVFVYSILINYGVDASRKRHKSII